MAKMTDTDRTTLRNRLRRIEGQVRGVTAMLDEDRDCREIVQQLAAIRAAVQGVSRAFLEQYMADCLLDPDDLSPERRAYLAHELAEMWDKGN